MAAALRPDLGKGTAAAREQRRALLVPGCSVVQSARAPAPDEIDNRQQDQGAQERDQQGTDREVDGVDRRDAEQRRQQETSQGGPDARIARLGNPNGSTEFPAPADQARPGALFYRPSGTSGRYMQLPRACSSALTWVQSGFIWVVRPRSDEHPEIAITMRAVMAIIPGSMWRDNRSIFVCLKAAGSS